jgi:hypothetical protein
LAEIQVASMTILRGNPVAYQAYLKRNYATSRTGFVDGTWKPAARGTLRKHRDGGASRHTQETS